MLPKPLTAKRIRASYISKETWCVIDTRVSLLREPTRDLTRIKTLGLQIRAVLNAERRQQEEETRAAVELLIKFNSCLRIDSDKTARNILAQDISF